jgi:replicative DNA helicase
LLWATDVLVKVMDAAEARERERKRTGKPVLGLLTGIRKLDEILGGLNGGLYFLGGPPGVGKTSFALQVANVVAKDTPVIYVTFENSAENLTLKAVCERAGISTQDVLRGVADMQHLAAVATEWARDVAYRLAFIEGTAALSVSDLRARAVELMSQHKIGRCLIIVDYLQLWGKGAIAYRGLDTARSRVETLGAELRELAMSLKSPLLAISSQNRQQGSYGDGTGRTSLDSLKESGDLEYMCDAALFLVGSTKRTATPPARALDLDVKKYRDGDTGIVHLIFRPDISRFREEEQNV